MIDRFLLTRSLAFGLLFMTGIILGKTMDVDQQGAVISTIIVSVLVAIIDFISLHQSRENLNDKTRHS
jgi:hypothetical protein